MGLYVIYFLIKMDLKVKSQILATHSELVLPTPISFLASTQMSFPGTVALLI